MSQQERDELVHILQSRLRDEPRAQLVADIKESNAEFKAGSCLPATSAEIVKQMLS